MLSKLDQTLVIRFIQPAKFVLNGGIATVVHFSVLTFCLKVLLWQSAGLSNLMASAFGITSSFLGNRYFVFTNSTETAQNQLVRFLTLSLTLSAVHYTVMHVSTDIYHYDYRVSFVLATIIQTILSFLGNKIMVFKA